MRSRQHVAAVNPLLGCLIGLLAFTALPAQAQGTALAPVCLGNVWSGDATRDRVSEKLNDAEALSVRAVRHATGGSAITGGGIPRARAVADVLRARGFTALLQVTLSKSEEILELTPEEVYAGGTAWGPFLREYSDVYRHGVQVDNESNNKITHQYRRALAEGGSQADAMRAARERAEQAAMFVTAFAEGVRSTCSECRIAPGGLGNLGARRRDAAVMYLELLAPHVHSGLVAPVLDVHVYRGHRAFSRDGGGALRWQENFTAEIDAILEEAGWPATTALQSTEVNVPPDDGWSSPEAHAEALSTLIRGLRGVPRMRLVCPFSPWADSKEGRWLISPNAPAGEAVRQASR